MSESIEKRAMRWAVGRDTGASSQAIMQTMTDGPPRDGYCYPHDSDDFGRCYRLLAIIPEWRPRIGEMANVGREWAALAERWDDLEALYQAQKHDDLYKLIQKLVRPHEDKRDGFVRALSAPPLSRQEQPSQNKHRRRKMRQSKPNRRGSLDDKRAPVRAN